MVYSNTFELFVRYYYAVIRARTRIEYHEVRGPQHTESTLLLVGHSLEATLSTQRVCSDLDHNKMQRMEKGGYVGLLGLVSSTSSQQFESFGGSAPGAANHSSLFISGDAVTQGSSKDKKTREHEILSLADHLS